MRTDPLLAEKHIKDAAARVSATGDALERESVENRRAYERFYNSLALFSGGSVALSITYLGYLKSLPSPPTHVRWMIASWGCLLACLAMSLFWTLFNTHYMHFARLREYNAQMKLQRKAEAEALDPLRPVNLSPAERSSFEARLRESSDKYAQQEKRLAWRESLYSHLWVWIGRLARLLFLAGLISLFRFALYNT